MLLPGPVVLRALGPVSGGKRFCSGRYSQTTCLFGCCMPAAVTFGTSSLANPKSQIPLVDGGEFGREVLANT